MSRVFAVLAENYGETILKQQHLNLCFPSMQLFNTLPTHFLHDRKQCPVSTATNQSGCPCARACILAKQLWVCELSEECVLRNQGESFLVSVPVIVLSPWKVHSCGWKTKPAELCLTVTVEKYPPTNRPTVYLQGGSHFRQILTYREHINSPAGCQTELHFTRRLLCV